MRKFYLLAACTLLCTCVFFYYQMSSRPAHNRVAITGKEMEEEEEKDGYDGPGERDELEFEKTVDPALGYVPAERLYTAIEYTESEKRKMKNARQQGMLLWTERGPIYDTVGPSNGNGRAGVNYTSGRIIAFLVDTLADPTGNTVFTGGVAGGLWKTTNFLSTTPNWQPINDFFDNLAISSIAQDPSNPDVLYFSTGEPTANADAVNGGGLWKSTDHGKTWNRLPGTQNFVRSFKMLVDKNGFVYLAARTTSVPVVQTNGLYRSKDGGATWTNITPTGLTSNNSCQDIELSSTGRFHASFGYRGAVVNHRYTDDVANVTSTSGWNASTGINPANLTANRLDLDVVGNVVYAVTINSSNNIDFAYKSVDGGATFTQQNPGAAYPAALTNTQGWYNVALAVNPDNTNEFIVGGLDAYRSVNSGTTVAKITNWVSTAPYVHADHHNMQWFKTASGESRVIIACDGGLFLSRNGGVDWADKNRNLAIKQFYAAAIHPAAGSNYLLAGAQDNGTHQLKYSGLSSSVEVTGGDGCYVHINQKDPNIQFGSYVFNQYRRTTNGGQTWSSINFSSTAGMFVNPFDYDDLRNIMYASWASNTILRWTGANTGTSATTITLPGLGTPSAFKASSDSLDRVFIGSNTGRLFRLDKASTVTAATVGANLKNISGASFPNGFLNCVNTGTTDNYLVAVFTNYGINNVWYSKDGGSSWTAIDGNLPDMPVRWAMFVPGQDDKLVLATEAGVYTTQKVDGSSTVWSVNPGFPTVKTNMLKLRTSDNTVVAATHGRGLFTAVIPTTENPEVVFSTASTTVTEASETLEGCRGYKDYRVNVGILNPATGDATVTYNVKGAGTAVKGVDYDLTTNGDFSNPSSQHVFASGATAAKVVTIRVYDDAEIEQDENFTIAFSITGNTTAIPGTSNSTHLFTIKDNGDRAPKFYEYADYAIGTFNATMSGLNTPFDGTKLKHRIQYLYTANELRAKGLDAKALISSLNIRVSKKNTTQPFKGLTVALSNNGISSFGNYVGGTFTTVWNGDYNTVQGDNTFKFVQPFTWDGVSNIVVQFCYDNTGQVPDGKQDELEGNSGPLGSGVRASVYSNHTTATTPGCSINASFIDDYRINATFGATFGNRIASALGSTKTEYLNANNDIYYYTADSASVLARVHNLSTNNYGCTEVVIDREGKGTLRFWNNAKKNYLMEKTYRIIPSNNAAGKYEVTFYFTKEEKEGWEAGTGQSWSNIQLLSTLNRVADVGKLDADNDGKEKSEIQSVVTTTKGTFGTGYTLTATLDGKFGGFGFGIPGSITNLMVKADKKENSRAANNTTTDIDVEWTTSMETNSSVFEIEKSYDGINFRKVGTVQASVNKFTPTTYHFIDHENVEMNYYRIRMIHQDGEVLMSKTTLVKNRNAVQNMFVLTNPFRSDIRLRFAKVPQSQVVFSLYDMSGKLVKRYTEAPSADVATFSTSTANLVSNGIYMLDVLVDGKHYKAKLVKQ